MKIILALILTLFFNNIFSQIAKDTTFTEASELLKVQKKFPQVSLAQTPIFEKVKIQKNVKYLNLGERKLFLDAYIFQSEKKKPAIVMIHGGGWKSGSKEMMKSLASKVSENGYQVFAVEYRLSDEAQYPAAINDVLTAIQFVKENARTFNVDREKIAVLGTSSGGQMAALIGAKYSKEVNLVVDIDGILAFHHPKSEEGKLATKWFGGSYEQIPKVWEDASALHHAESVTVPYLFINSQFERFSAGQDEMIAILREHKITTKVRKIENSPHTFWMFNPWFEKTVNEILLFLNKEFKL